MTIRRYRFWAAAFVLINLVDALLTAWAVRHGHSEMNPLMALTIAWGGLWCFVAVKMSVAVAAASWLELKRSWVLLGGTALVSLVVVWNIVLLTFFR